MILKYRHILHQKLDSFQNVVRSKIRNLAKMNFPHANSFAFSEHRS